VPLRLEIGRTEDLLFAVLDILAFSTGFSFAFTIRCRVPPDPHAYMWPPDVSGGSLHLGLAFVENAPSTVALSRGGMGLGGTSLSPCLVTSGSSSGGLRRWTTTDVWASPLPPPGRIVFSCDWESESVAELRREIDAQPILEAAAQVEQLWPA